ncbi:MAG: hypothetical protein M1818_004454 [Claussenomyces sp. TS43310]|nr:MAG: hypothetical protein M1818_004454 [Claussenomyces sp. TS43310]
MKAVFLGERDAVANGSIELGTNAYSPPDESVDAHGYFGNQTSSRIDSWLEVWDYGGGCSFRGFVAGAGEARSLFAFFDASVIGRDLKQGLMALIELASTPFECSQLVVCLERTLDPKESKSLLKSFRWVGFELVTLEMWSRHAGSDRWLFLGMEL